MLPGVFTVLTPTGPGTSFTDPKAAPRIAYLYRVRAFDADGGYIDYSNLDLATEIVFTDDPLIGANDAQGRPATAVYARHLLELRTNLNPALSAHSMAQVPDDGTLQSPSQRPIIDDI